MLLSGSDGYLSWIEYEMSRAEKYEFSVRIMRVGDVSMDLAA
jgi:hypothetical protein